VHPARLTPSACYRPIAAVVGPVEDTMSPVRSLNDTELLSRILVGFALAFLIGFERELRGSPAGDRTFALIGSAAASAAAVTGQASPQALAGIVTGVGFIGGGLILKGRDGDVRGVTTAATVFATAVVGLVVGLGHLLMGVVAAGLTLLILELRFLPGIRLLDAHRYQSRVRPDDQGPG
jgi:putative Mg2+ transporter-C (MgtC) family protein